ncbi:unnamed protein product [Cunninghamella blakesleeana]
MNQIYKNAIYILTVPDLHNYYLYQNIANREIIDLIYKHKDTIHHDITHHPITDKKNNVENSKSDSTLQANNNNDHYNSVIQNLMNMDIIKDNGEIKKYIEVLKNKIGDIRKENEELRKGIEGLKIGKKEDELKKVYGFLAYLLNDWSDRVWVISEYQIAKEKYIKHRTPLKYIFVSLLWNDDQSATARSFFSYSFTDQHNSKISNINDDPMIDYEEVDNNNKFISFLESKFIQRSHINMMVGSNASRNEDRFYAILPSWSEYKSLIHDKNTNITDMQSVKLKLYEILNDDDLWEKARLLVTSSICESKPVFPTFATYHQPNNIITEMDYVDYSHKWALHYTSELNIDHKILYTICFLLYFYFSTLY